MNKQLNRSKRKAKTKKDHSLYNDLFVSGGYGAHCSYSVLDRYYKLHA